jgi:hypothetical protein
MRFKNLLPLLFIFPVFISGCKKSDSCPSVTTVQITPNLNSITVNWDLSLSANYSSLNRYEWTGPNGWNIKTTAAVVTRPNMQFQDAGLYKVRVYNLSNCLIQQGEINITVESIQDAPCNGTLSNNSCITDVFNIGNFNYGQIYFSFQPGNNRTVGYCSKTNTGSTPYVALTFSGVGIPKPGIYKTIYTWGTEAGKENEVSVILTDGTGEWYRSIGQQHVYVTLVNGKTQVCICNITMGHYLGNKVISTKVTFN